MTGTTLAAIPMDRELRRLLRHGTFAQALDRALVVRGLSLEQVQRRLADRDVRVSRAALSYWRRGRSRPEREESLRAVRALEDLIGLPAGSLVVLLGPPRPRGRMADAEPGAVDRARLWPSCGPALAAMDAPPEGQVRYLDVHEHVLVDEHRRLAEVRTTLVIEATTDRTDRCVVYEWAEESSRPVLSGLRYCRQGRTRPQEASTATVCELLLEQRLSAGERTVVEYTWSYPSGSVLTSFHRRFTRSARLYLLQVQFTGEVPPHCVPYRQPTLNSPRRPGKPLWIGGSGTAHLAVPDTGPGLLGLQWEWD
ncbi:XRE family transcriptional regulator [Amycolatopsis sp. PS_44_ISF1]|uniref:XRE family transcriptional regulator n=1 Tax=Amycolatopsis sp. PS_44_ISF1 TaxID=2974917 RepID=UPI0028E099DE|nr:XRE family transcriptional regulator [Amycolatopsis sp. PS_44_ISF1]MDT8914720.1 XRE family transcriptional regulator [Amycolatopsis sp. PS_44_ISF1]